MSERNMWIGVKGVDRRVADSEHGPQVLGEQEVIKLARKIQEWILEWIKTKQTTRLLIN